MFYIHTNQIWCIRKFCMCAVTDRWIYSEFTSKHAPLPLVTCFRRSCDWRVPRWRGQKKVVLINNVLASFPIYCFQSKCKTLHDFLLFFVFFLLCSIFVPSYLMSLSEGRLEISRNCVASCPVICTGTHYFFYCVWPPSRADLTDLNFIWLADIAGLEYFIVKAPSRNNIVQVFL